MGNSNADQEKSRTPGFTIQRANVHDIPRLLEIRDEATRDIFDLDEKADISEVLASTEAYYRRSIPNGEHIAALAVRSGETIGCGGVCLYDELPAPTNPSGACAFIMNVYVSPKARRQGVGRALMVWLIDGARERGACKIYLEASDSGAPLYESLGFKPMGGMMRLEDEFVHKGDAMHTRPLV